MAIISVGLNLRTIHKDMWKPFTVYFVWLYPSLVSGMSSHLSSSSGKIFEFLFVWSLDRINNELLKKFYYTFSFRLLLFSQVELKQWLFFPLLCIKYSNFMDIGLLMFFWTAVGFHSRNCTHFQKSFFRLWFITYSKFQWVDPNFLKCFRTI